MCVEWYEKLYIPIIKPSISSKITLTLFDEDTFGADEHAGAIEFNLNDVIDGKFRDLFWANIHGGPENVSNDTAVLMNKVPDLASTWHGRILIALEIVDSDRPTTKLSRINNEEYKEMIEE
mmetsp:Transcript_13394/g.2103  ORF Transcript_13394/g.2103 Transcript_13394/m.2103 type:complete len:121 (-) Transcript_13394:550-912(-)|eukprot:CAMPEP_0168316784 /NCGR_PEP_ID=MMETSP0210-20121227/19128_1 /TAXON_ID=40633 /ORGANISM="Condylostoma magnum, Strain COL2" /LENGTH=120 /DNA_ID=CAMNT_0008304369 /DNA_START=691 /DNA_END=1053 /DNA_ORIENTATION=-